MNIYLEDSKHYDGPARIKQFMDYSPRDCFFVAQDLKYTLKTTADENEKLANGWNDLDDDMKEALEQMSTKMGRIVHGDPWYEDSWRDIAGYATLVANRLEKL